MKVYMRDNPSAPTSAFQGHIISSDLTCLPKLQFVFPIIPKGSIHGICDFVQLYSLPIT